MSFSLVEIALVVSLLLSVAALTVAIIALKRSGQQTHESKELLARVNRELTVANTGAVGMGQRLVAMEKRLRDQESRPASSAQAQAAAAAPVADYAGDDEFRTYSEAVRLFRSGLGSEEVARRCGLSRAEASLIEAMQNAGQNAGKNAGR